MLRLRKILALTTEFSGLYEAIMRKKKKKKKKKNKEFPVLN